MKKWLIGLCFSALVAACLFSTSCEKYALPYLECNIDTIQAPVAGGVYDALITSNVRWAFSSETVPEWIYIDVKDGNGGYVDTEFPLKIKVYENKDAADRTSVMVFTSATLSRKFVVEQKGTGVEPEPEQGEGGGE